MSTQLMRQVRPFAGQPAKSLPVSCRTRVVNLRSLHYTPYATKSEEAVRAPDSTNLPLTIALALSTLGLTARQALAEDAVASNVAAAGSQPTLSAEDVEILAANSTGGGFETLFVSFLFGTVVLLLAIVTGGVAYINIKQFLDNRQEKEDREKEGKLPAASASSKGKAAEEEDGDAVVPLKRANRIKKEKGKGFASSELTSRR